MFSTYVLNNQQYSGRNQLPVLISSKFGCCNLDGKIQFTVHIITFNVGLVWKSLI